jgi:hypothetical protein
MRGIRDLEAARGVGVEFRNGFVDNDRHETCFLR